MRHIPNILSSFRIALIPVFVWQMLWGNSIVAGIILIVSGITDLLDGFLARTYNWVTTVGKILDPFADKLTQVTVCVVLAIKLPQYLIFFALLLIKDFVMLLLGSWLYKKKVKIEGARWFGKVVTTLFYIIIVAVIMFPELPVWAIIVMLSVITICAFVAGSMYIPQFLAYRRQAVNTQTETKDTRHTA